MSEAETEKKKSFWATLPGLLTATAATISAIGGLLVVLNQVGLLHRAGQPPTVVNDAAVLATARDAAGSRSGDIPNAKDVTILEEDFDNNIRGWHETDEAAGYAKVENGVYRIRGRKREGSYYSWLALDLDSGVNFKLEATIRQVGGPDNFGYGLFWAERQPVADQSIFEINDTGEVTYGKFAKESYSPVVSWTPTSTIIRGGANRLRVSRRDDKLELSVNNQVVRVVPFQPTRIGFIGFRVNDLVAIEVDEVRVTEPR
jgi:hypothetical protein